MAAPYKWFVPDAAAGGDGDSYDTAYNNINTAFAALSATYYILNIVPTLTGVIPASTIALSGLKGAITTFRFEIRLTDANGNVLADNIRFALDGNNALTNIMTFVDCAYLDFNGIDFKRATSHNLSFATTPSTEISFRNGSSQLSGAGNGIISAAINNRIYLDRFDLLSNGAAGFSGGQTGGGLKVDSSSISNNGGVGIESLLSPTITNSLIKKNGSYGIYVRNNYANVMGNIIDGNATANILLAAALFNANSFRDNLITNCAIGINNTTGAYYGFNNAFYGNTENEKTTTGKPISIENRILTEDPYIDQANDNYNYKPSYARRRVSVAINGFMSGKTAGIPGADVYPQDFYLDKSVVSVTAGTLITVTLKHLAATLMTGLTLKGVACTDRTVTGANTLTFVTPNLEAGVGNIEGIITGYDNFVIYNGITATNDAPPPGPDTVMGMLIKLHKQFYGTGKIEESPSGSGRFYLVLYDNDGGETDTVIAKCELKGYGGSAVASFVGNTSPCVRLKSTIDVVPTIPESATVLGILEKMINYEFGKKIQKEIPVGSGKFFEVTYDSAGTEIGRCALKAYGGAEIASPEGSTEPVERLRSTV